MSNPKQVVIRRWVDEQQLPDISVRPTLHVDPSSPMPICTSPHPKDSIMVSKKRSNTSPALRDIPKVVAEIRQPKKNILNPNVGNIEIWPAGAEIKHHSPPRSKDLKPVSSSPVINGQSVSAPPSPTPMPIKKSHQPRLLHDLDNFVEQELTMLNCPLQGPDPNRLEVFRTCFDIFTESFTTYKPILARIKQEYDLLVYHYANRIQELEPLEIHMKSLKEECERTVLFYKEVAEKSHALYAEEQEKSKKLEAVIEDLRLELSSMKHKLEVYEQDLNDVNEAARLLESKLRVFQNENQEMMTDLHDIQIRYEDRNIEVEHLRIQINQMVSKELLEKSTTELIKTRDDLAKKTSEYASSCQQLENLQTKISSLENRVHVFEVQYTPRPGWDYIPTIFPDISQSSGSSAQMLRLVVESHKKVSQELSTLKDYIIDQLEVLSRSEKARPKGDEYLIARGYDEKVPIFLRWHGKVKNRLLSKVELEAGIKEIMTQRIASPPEELEISLGEFIKNALSKKFIVPSLVAEWGYSLLDACKRYDYEPEISLFAQIIEGEIHEEVYVDVQKLGDKLKKAVMKAEAEIGSKTQGFIAKAEFRNAIKKAFPNKSEDDINALGKTYEAEHAGNQVEYERLFIEGKDGNTFLAELRTQHLRERQLYLRDIEEIIREGCATGELTVSDARQALLLSDSKKPKNELIENINRGFGCESSATLDDMTKTSIDRFLSNLRRGIVRRYGKRETKKKMKSVLCRNVGEMAQSATISKEDGLAVIQEGEATLQGPATGQDDGTILQESPEGVV